jgi:UDP-N-acetyl-D-galactosamine dehydrogenase
VTHSKPQAWPDDASDARVVVVGLGYVGLPLAVALAQRFDVVGFDINVARIADLKSGRIALVKLSRRGSKLPA